MGNESGGKAALPDLSLLLAPVSIRYDDTLIAGSVIYCYTSTLPFL